MTNTDLIAFALIAAISLLLFAVVFRSIWRRARRVSAGLSALEASLESQSVAIARQLAAARATLAEQGAAAELALWKLARFDEVIDRTTASLAQGRVELDATRVKLERGRADMERLKSALRLIMRALELRRTFLA